MKKHNALKVSLITLFVFMLLTWILPAATYQSSYSEIGRSQVGIFDLLSYQNTVLGYFGYISLKKIYYLNSICFTFLTWPSSIYNYLCSLHYTSFGQNWSSIK